MASHNQLGKKGEDMAVEYLVQKGHRIICRNYRQAKAEVDIISIIAETIVFTEVKTRSTDGYGLPEEAIGNKKKQMLREVMEYYLLENKIKEEARFDIISIVAHAKGTEIYHIEDAFYH